MMSACCKMACLALVSLALTLTYVTGQTCPPIKQTHLFNPLCCNSLNVAYRFCVKSGAACCCDPVFAEKANCVPITTTTGPTTTTTPPTTTTTTPAPTTTHYLASTARCPAPVPRLLGGDKVPPTCADPGLIGFAFNFSAISNDYIKLCNGIFVFDTSLRKRVVRMSEICYQFISTVFSNGAQLEGLILNNTFNIPDNSFENTNFQNSTPTVVNGVVTLVPTVTTERIINSFVTVCDNVACEKPSSTSAKEINFNNCTVYSYGYTNNLSDDVVPADLVAVSVDVERYGGWDQQNPCQPILDQMDPTVPKPNKNPICFVTVDGSNATCHASDESSPLLCWTKDGIDELLMGFTYTYIQCSQPVGAFLVYPY